MKMNNSILLCLTVGPYGHEDAFAAIALGNAILARDMDISIVLRDDGVYVAHKNQDPSKIGVPNNLDILRDFIELGGKVYVSEGDMRERGLSEEDLIEGVEVISSYLELIESHDVILTF
ncbi:MAG: DsrE family protein [Archaeoglobi archaeon]|nr:DsrE family protein [Candidatus Mnemosynella sp.]